MRPRLDSPWLRRLLGMSLISLMVGLLLAMIGILAGMTLYKNIVQTSIQTRNDTLQDGQIASAMLTLQLEVQNAGFGIPPGGTVAHVVQSGTAIYWRFAQGNGAKCKGFRIQDLDTNTARRELQLLKTRDGTACNLTDALTSFQWDVDSVLAAFRASPAADADLPVIAINLANAECFPYSIGTAAQHPVVTVTVDNAAISAAKKVGSAPPNAPFVYSFCLSNI